MACGWSLRRGDTLPLVDVSIQIETGITASPVEAPGLANFALSLMDKGTEKYDLHELAAEMDAIAMVGAPRSGIEASEYSFRILHSRLGEALDIAAEVLRRPTYPDEEINKLKQQFLGWLATVRESTVARRGRPVPQGNLRYRAPDRRRVDTRAGQAGGS